MIILGIYVKFESNFTFEVICNSQSLDQISSNAPLVLKYIIL